MVMTTITTNLSGTMGSNQSLVMGVCFGGGLVPSVAAVMKLVSLAAAARVGTSAVMESRRRRSQQERSRDMMTLKTEQCADFNRISSLPSSAS